jgi:PAS domain S-box-containing protein
MRQRLDLYGSILKQLPLGMYLFCLEDESDDRTLRLIATNPAATEETGVPMDSVLGTLLDESFPRLREQGLPQAYADVIRSGIPRTFDTVVYGDRRIPQSTFTVWAIPLPGQCIAVLFRNVTQTKQAEEALRQSEARFRSVFEDAPLGMAIFDLDFRFVKVNAMLCQMVGYSEQEMVQRMFPDITHPDDVEMDRDLARKIFSQEIPSYQVEKRYRRQDGTVFWGLLTASVIRDDQGKPCYGLAMIKDITERKRHEEEIYRLNEALRQRARELQRLNQELESFSYSVSHDLRAPLRSMDGFSQALLEDYTHVLDAEGQDYLHRIRAASQRMGHLIDDLLHLSRVTRSDVHMQSVDLSAIVHTIAADMQQRDSARPVVWDIAEGVIAEGDPWLLRTALEDLLDNAWKFTVYEPSPQITFGIAYQEGQAVYFVRDNGAGFDMAYAARLFGAFQRLHTTTEFPGSGIGLATVQRIIHRHGGYVWAEGAVGSGATFSFTLKKVI